MSSRTQPALLGGLVMGVLSALPIIGIGNMCCCMWVIAGGGVAAYLLQAQQVMPITAAEGATVGLLAGLVGAVVHLLISLPIHLMLGPFQGRVLRRVLENFPDVPDSIRYGVESAGVGVVGTIVNFFFMLVIGAIFATVGGIIGAALFAKRTPIAPPTE